MKSQGKARQKQAGINVPVFSLRSQKSLGSGEFYDLIPLISWAKKIGLGVIEILPINDTSMTQSALDGYPYSILSAFALHPLYIHIQSLAPRRDFSELIEELNHPRLCYEEAYLIKIEILKEIFELRGEKDLQSAAFKMFYQKQKEHLKAYGAFCFLRDFYGTSDFRFWDEDQKYSPKVVNRACKNKEVEFFYFIQFHLHKQLGEVKRYAKKMDIRLKGDFPIGVHPNSVEAWRFFDSFRWDQSIGAPPDFYNAYGQNWGFPSYDWEKIKKDGFNWFKERLVWMEQYFDLVRLDHVLGYFRLWEIPVTEVRGLMGSFFPSIGYSKEELAAFGLKDLKRLLEPFGEEVEGGYTTQSQVKDKWEKAYEQLENRLFFYRHGAYHPRVALEETKSFALLSEEEQKRIKLVKDAYFLDRQEALWERIGKDSLLAMKEATKMEICAEDIGVIPSCVGKVLKELGIPNLYIQRMPKSFECEFDDPKDFPDSCVCTPSNHDTATLRQWWEEDPKATKRYFRNILKQTDLPPEKLTSQVAHMIIDAHLTSNAYLAIFLLQDLFALDEQLAHPQIERERINDPKEKDWKWDYRMHLYLEELLLAKDFTRKLQTMVQKGDR